MKGVDIMLKNYFNNKKVKKEMKKELIKDLDFKNAIIDKLRELIENEEDYINKSNLIILQLNFIKERDNIIAQLTNF